MSEWFVYCAPTYYPWHAIIEAETAQEAAEKFGVCTDPGGGFPVAIFPLDALAYVHDLEQLIEDAQHLGSR